MKCYQATKLISAAHERSLSFTEKVGVQAHLLTCPHCRNFERNCRHMSKLMKKFAKDD